MEDIEIILEEPETTEVETVEEVVTLVREYIAGKNISIEDNVINCTYEYILPSSVVMDSKYVHTDNNFTNEEKAKLATLENADLSDYYTKAQTDKAISDSMGDYYTKQETRTMILQDLESYYTKDEVDESLAKHYTKTETDEKISTAKNDTLTEVSNNYYNKTEVDSKIASGGGGASTASEMTISDIGGYFASSNVEGALQELGAELAGLASAVNAQSEVVV